MKKLVLLLAVLLLASALSTYTQTTPGAEPLPENFRDQIGLPLGLLSGITARIFNPSGSTLEVREGFPLVATRLSLTGLYEVFKPMSAGFNLFFGRGTHLGDYTVVYTRDNKNYSSLIFGVDGIIRADYLIPQSAFDLGLDGNRPLILFPSLAIPEPCWNSDYRRAIASQRGNP